MSDKERREAGSLNSTIKRHFSKKEDTNKIKSNLKRFRRKSTNRRHLDEKNETRYVPLANNRNRHVDKRSFKDEARDEKMSSIRTFSSKSL